MDIPSNWTFEKRDIASEFNVHVREQLPWYDILIGGISHIARHYIPKYGRIYDIGAGTGNIGIILEDVINDRQAEYLAIEESKEMVEQYQGPGKIITCDATDFEYESFDLAILNLVLMFIPVAKRNTLLDQLRERMNPGGALIICDKAKESIPLLVEKERFPNMVMRPFPEF